MTLIPGPKLPQRKRYPDKASESAKHNAIKTKYLIILTNYSYQKPKPFAYRPGSFAKAILRIRIGEKSGANRLIKRILSLSSPPLSLSPYQSTEPYKVTPYHPQKKNLTRGACYNRARGPHTQRPRLINISRTCETANHKDNARLMGFNEAAYANFLYSLKRGN
ncbi:hypothetical protein GWI33_009355 [Rhynchophorus ferrugineus]|uniref:Uncharacterized protein n=1 Tax=Rhynchophorus ferrugineus TaxID=354439 RepID=A0A834I9V6_RHYFE|nr:hypothetical protein GWI33_009355 [Rhynchophorus ferrugineus]